MPTTKPSTPSLLSVEDDLHEARCRLKALVLALPRLCENGAFPDTADGVIWLFDDVVQRLERVQRALEAVKPTSQVESTMLTLVSRN